MNNTQSQEIVARFYEALDSLIKVGHYKSLYAFAKKYGFQNSVLYRSYRDHASGKFQMAWMVPLIENHSLNLNFIFTGEGLTFNKGYLKKHRISSVDNQLVSRGKD